MSQLPLFDIPPEQAGDPNPMVRACGLGPDGFICRDCAHLIQFQQANTWYKCELRSAGGPKTDHRVRWKACAKFHHIMDDFTHEEL